MPVSTTLTTSFKVELMQGLHNFTNGTGNAFKIALYTSTASYGATTTAYSAVNEITGTGYTAGGNTLTNVTPTSSGTTAFTDFVDTVWTTATFTANGCMIYNSTNANRSVATIAFGSDRTATAGDFTIIFPTADATNAIIRIA